MTVRLGLTDAAGKRAIPVRGTDASPLIRRYQDSRNVGRAADLMSATTAAGLDLSDIGTEAVQVAQQSSLPLLRELADWIVEGDQTVNDGIPEAIDSRRRIARLKRIVVVEPRNAVRWVDLAREYLALGQADQATRAMKAALMLAPNDRFVLRSATVLFEHTGEADRALHLLATSPRISKDPWLASAAVALADHVRAEQTNARLGRRILDNVDAHPRHLTELAAALGTLEYRVGSGRRGRQLLRQSVAAPTENSLAQVVWADEQFGVCLSEEAPADVMRNFEARARQYFQLGDWKASLDAAACWLDDQPFSLSAASFASATACNACDWDYALQLARAGLTANPNDAGLMNNLAYALAEAGRLREAAKWLVSARRVKSSLATRAVLTATEGFLLFRCGQAEHGRHRYERSIEVLSRLRDTDSAAKAALMVAREEVLRGGSDVERLLS